MGPTVTEKSKGWFGTRSDFSLTIPGVGEDEKDVSAKIDGVRTYGKILGWCLYKLGYASKTQTGSYINTNSFFKHLTETVNRGQSKIIFKKIYDDKDLNKADLTNKKIAQIYMACFVGNYRIKTQNI